MRIRSTILSSLVMLSCAFGVVSAQEAGSDAPPIAPPAPDAKPEDVQKAKEVAKTAELTPIIPSPNNPTRPAFQLYAEVDPPVLATGTVFALARRFKQQPAYCSPLCDKAALNGLDSLTAGFYSSKWSRASDIGLWTLGAGSLTLVLVEEGPLNTLNDGVVVVEATLTSTALASIMTLAAGRPRPFLYSETAPLSVRNSSDASLSFLSSHTSMAFAVATSVYITEHRLQPHGARSKITLGVGLSLASFVGFARIMAGYHFITDVIGGAVVGSSCGVLVASIHGSPVHVVPIVKKDETGKVESQGLGIAGAF